jgi:hypothetical protein
MSTLSVKNLLNVPTPSYHPLLNLARARGRAGKSEDRTFAIELLDGLRQRYGHVLAIGQELVFELMEDKQHDRAQAVLTDLERSFPNLEEEILCRWGRLFKDRGDTAMRLPWADPDGQPPDIEVAEGYYQKSRDKYGQAYNIRSGHYPGINKATLLLMLGSLRPALPKESPRPEIQQSVELAGKLLADRSGWPREQADDETLWHPATAGEAHLLRQEWTGAVQQYREALRASTLTSHAREAMFRQVERIRMCFVNLGVSIPAPLDDPATFLGRGTAASATAAPASAPPPSSARSRTGS